jgi:hypothetical protein
VKPEKKQAVEGPKDNALQPAKMKGADAKTDKRPSQPEVAKPSSVKPIAALEKKAAPLKQAASSKSHYTVQVSSHQEKTAAEDEVKKMKQHGYAAFIASSELPGKGTWYRALLSVQLQTALRNLKLAEEQVNTAREALRLAEVQHRNEMERFRLGRSTAFQVSQFQQQLLEARLAEIQARVGFERNDVQRLVLTNRLLEHYNLTPPPGQKP